MKSTKMKKTVATIVTAGILSLGVAAFAATGALTPAQIVDELTPMTLEEVQAAREEGDTYGAVAEKAGVLEDFKASMLENRTAAIEARVVDGTLTREEADEILAAMQTQIANCDGSGTMGDRLGQKFGAAFGQGSGLRDGSGTGTPGGRGMGRGMSRGMGRGAGVATN